MHSQTLVLANPSATEQVAAAYPSMASYASDLVDACARLNIDPAWLANVIWVESKGDPKARNPSTDASGLIQFMPRTAAGLGTTTTAIRGLTGAQQIPLVEKYFSNVIRQYGALKSQEDVLAAVFYPAYIGRPLDTFSAEVQRLNHGMKNMREYTTILSSKALLPVEGIGQSVHPSGGGTAVVWSVSIGVAVIAVLGLAWWVKRQKS